MTNHVHLLITPERSDAVPRVIIALGRRYVQYINTTYRRTGTLWESRCGRPSLQRDDVNAYEAEQGKLGLW